MIDDQEKTSRIKDVAEKAGVSEKTVSRVLNHDTVVKEATKTRVLNAMKELNYQPNSSARSLRNNRSFMIGLLFNNPNPVYVQSLYLGAQPYCRENNYHLILEPVRSAGEESIASIYEFIRQTRVDGLILTPPLSDERGLIEFLQNRGIPFARISPLAEPGLGATVYSDDTSAAYEMTEFLISLGHEDIAIITGFSERSGSQARLKGYKQALSENGIEMKDAFVCEGEYTFESGERCARKLLRMDQKPTAIFAGNDYMAAGVLKAAKLLGLSVPFDLSVAGFDDAPIAQHVWPALSTVKYPIETMGHLAAKTLLQQLRDADHPQEQIRVQSDIVKRESTAIFAK